MNYSIGDLIIRIKNGYMSHKETILSPHSKFRVEILTKLKNLGYIKDFEVTKDKNKRIIIDLSYVDSVGAMTDVKIFSTPGRRLYSTVKKIKPVLGGLGVGIVSTSKGILTDKEAKKQKIGGEFLFEIW